MSMDKQEWLLKRNCSLSPRQLGLAYVVLCVMSFAVAATFTMMGAWQVMIFALLEMAAVALAFLVYARHATDHEHIALTEGCLLIEQFDGGEVHQVRLDPCRTRVGVPRRSQDLICFEARGVRVEVGRFVPAARRRQIAHELRLGVAGRSLR
ncbi:MAG TPA: DUF2244 domain-containing protein [Noviherbaspirillum sp.]|jgi:uncharacterized membrane protein|uniref:DUF2244 domain-containing protein n=1 Tax=Noviherbaspirillum sp. TaxID=1926288 RepID=UPI002F920249